MYTASVYENRVTYAAKILLDGGLVACPTDTVFALAADCRNESAVARVYDAKGRPANSPLPLLVSGMRDVEAIAAEVPQEARVLMERFWPGPLTLILPAQSWLPRPLVQDGGVGVRQPDDPFCCRLIEKVGAPITGTSANRTGEPPAMTADEAEQQLGKAVDYYLDAGVAGGAQPSTVVRITASGVDVLRNGPITEQTLRDTVATAG